MNPQSRNEAILQAILDGTSSSELQRPQSRNEDLLQKILDKLNEGGGGGGSLSELSDTAIDTPSNNDVLTYDSSSNKWKNAAGGSGGGLVVHADNEGVFDKTWQEVTDALEEGLFVTVAASNGSNNGASQSHIITTYVDNGVWYVTFPDYLEMSPATTDSASGYPILVYD